MVLIDQSLLRGKTRDKPIAKELVLVLTRAGNAAGIDKIFVTSGGQPGTRGKSTGSTRHNGGRAADLRLVVDGKTLTFTDSSADPTLTRFVIAAAAHGANGIGAGVHYMGNDTLHVGFGRSVSDNTKLVWGAGGHSRNAPQWLRDAAKEGWFNPQPWVFDVDDGDPEDLPEDRDDVFDEEEHDEDVPVVIVTPPALDDIPARFSREVILAAQATERRWGTPASVTLAQWALESGYGKSMPAGSNNPFGIKAVGSQKTVAASTAEFVGGKWVRRKEPFRAFASLDEAFIEHGELLGKSRHYVEARKHLDDPDRFADALTGIYATDPQYGSKLKQIMRSNNLYRFDDAAAVVVAPRVIMPEEPVSEPLHRGDARKTRVTALQERLVALGYKLGEVDGKFGSLTEAAVLAFQAENGLPSDGVVDDRTEAALDVASTRRLDEKRLRATEKDLAEGGSRIVVNAQRSRLLSWITAGLGALGVGNSAVINAAGQATTAATTTGAGAIPSGLLPFLADVQKLAPGANAAEFTRLSDIARTLSAQVSAAAPSPELVAWLSQVRKTISPDVLAKYPDIATILDALSRAPTQPTAGMRTIFDILPTFFAQGGNLQAIMEGVAGVGASVLPGFGGSAAILGAALASRFFANNIAAARVEDHQNGNTISPLKP